MRPMRKMTTAPVPAPTPLPKQGSSGPEKRKRAIVIVIVVAVLVGGAVLYARARSKSSSEAAEQRYCRLSAKLVEELAAVGVAPAGPVSASIGPEAITRVLTRMGGEIDELEREAPSKIRGDVRSVTAALKQAGAGDAAGIRSSAFVEAGRSIAGFRPTVCGPAASEDGTAMAAAR